MAASLIGSGTASGAVVGLVAGLVLAPLAGPPPGADGGPPSRWVLAAVAAGVLLDGIRLAAGHPAPPTVGRQVPREWGWIFPPVVTAGLFGARLGVGPLTILSTWTWWSATVVAGLLGPGAGAAVGACFGLVRLSVTAGLALAAGLSQAVWPGGHPLVFGRLRAGRRRGWATITLLTAALTVIAACGTPEPTPGEVARPRALAPPGEGRDAGTRPLIEPAQLEDIVRTSTPGPTTTAPDRAITSGSTAEGTASPTADTADPSADDLLEALVAAIPGYEPIDDPAADRALDLQAATELQPDPTEEIALLETRGFRGGWTRAFRNEVDDVAVASVYRFRDPAEAAFYLEDGLITIGGYGGTFFDIPDLPGVRGFAQRIASSDGEATEELVSLGAAFSRGDRWYLIYFVGSPATVTPEVLVPAVAAQVATATG